MKIVFLLALASGLSGLASCKSILPGGDRAKNVELEYTYVDEFGKLVKVKVQSDLINLSGIREVEEKKSEPSFYRVAADLRKPQVQFRPEPLVKTVYVPAPKPQVRYVVAPAAPVIPQPQVRYVLQHDEPKAIEIDTEDSEIKFTVQQPKVHTIYVKAPAPAPAFRTVELKAPKPEVVYVTAPEPKTIKLELDVKEPEDHHIFFAPSVRRTVQVAAPEPEVKHVLPAHFIAASHTPKYLKTTSKIEVNKSNDDDDLGSSEK